MVVKIIGRHVDTQLSKKILNNPLLTRNAVAERYAKQAGISVHDAYNHKVVNETMELLHRAEILPELKAVSYGGLATTNPMQFRYFDPAMKIRTLGNKTLGDILKFGAAVPEPNQPLESINPPKSANTCVF